MSNLSKYNSRPLTDISEVNLRIRAQLLRDLFSRLTSLLQVHSEGCILLLSEQVDEVYIRIRRTVESILQTDGFQKLHESYPKGEIPSSLHALGEDADIFWDGVRNALNGFTGDVIEFCVTSHAGYGEGADLLEKEVLAPYDRFIESFKKTRRQAEKRWLEKAEIAGKQFQEQFDSTGSSDVYVNAARIAELRAIHSDKYDLSRLIELCDEANKTYADGCYMAVAMLARAILDHVPPIFGCKSFAEVANNVGGSSKSFKQSMANLEASSRKIADAHLHTQIRKKEVLPNKTQVNFSNDLDVLLAEIVRLLK